MLCQNTFEFHNYCFPKCLATSQLIAKVNQQKATFSGVILKITGCFWMINFIYFSKSGCLIIIQTIGKKVMEYFKKVMSIMCLFDIEQQQKEAVSLKRYITINCKTPLTGSNSKIDQATVIKEMCGTLETHELGIKAPWVKLEKNKKILLLDLDKTLIYFSHSTGLLLRPFLNYFLNEVKKLYSIYLFTSATKSYVKQIFQRAKALKAQLSSIKGILTRQNCIKIVKQDQKKVYVKDLRILTNCQLSDVVLVDDLPVSYCMNEENAVPISPYAGQTNDEELKKIAQILLKAAEFEDVRDYLSRMNSVKIKKQVIKQMKHIKVERVHVKA